MRQYTPLQVNVPAGTAQASPVTKTWVLYPGYVHGWRIDIPAAHAGLTGVRIVYQGTPIVPFDLSAFLVVAGQTFNVPYEDEIMNNGLVVQAFNTDIYPHAFYLYADVDPHLPGEAPPGAIIRGRTTLFEQNAAAIRDLTSV